MNAKFSTTCRNLSNLVDQLELLDKELNEQQKNELAHTIQSKIIEAKKELDFTNRLRDEILRMKSGSIALVNQITTISKIRIYDPKTDHDLLSNIKLSNEKLDLIDRELTSRYTNIKPNYQ